MRAWYVDEPRTDIAPCDPVHSSRLTFDYVTLLLAAAAIAAAGLVQDSSVTVVASMLLSPLMAPILAITFGLAVGDRGLTRRGMRNELVGVLLCLAVGGAVGSVLAPLFGPHAFNNGDLDPHRSTDGEIWAAYAGSNASWPYQLESTQIRSRGSASSLVSGTLIAIPSGFAVVLAMTSGAQNALVGVAIAAALLPPVVNAGLCFALAFWWQVLDPQASWWRDLTELWDAHDWADLLLGNSGGVRATPTQVALGAHASAAAVAGDAAAAAALTAAAATMAAPMTTVTTTTVMTGEDAGEGGAVAANVTTITMTTTTTTTIPALTPSLPQSARRHPYLVVAVHGVWSFVLFVLNLISIVLVGTVTFWLKGVSQHAEDSAVVMGANRRQRRTLLRTLWHDAVESVMVGGEAKGLGSPLSQHASQLRAGASGIRAGDSYVRLV